MGQGSAASMALVWLCTSSWQRWSRFPLLRSSSYGTRLRFSAEQVLLEFARREKSWKRLRHLVDLASTVEPSTTRGTVVDVGTDHGFLAVALAATGKFERVVGVDISKEALHQGAWKLQSETTKLSLDCILDFRQSCGLEGLRPGEATTVCIAGMGVNTMIFILTAEDSLSGRLLLDVLDTRKLVLQPTNSRPHNLVRLYDRLDRLGWGLEREKIEFLASRWYVSALFLRESTFKLPGEMLCETNDDHEKDTFRAWVKHHVAWISSDASKAGGIPTEDSRWLTRFQKE